MSLSLDQVQRIHKATLEDLEESFIQAHDP